MIKPLQFNLLICQRTAKVQIKGSLPKTRFLQIYLKTYKAIKRFHLINLPKVKNIIALFVAMFLTISRIAYF